MKRHGAPESTAAQNAAPKSVKLLGGSLTLYARRDSKIWWAGFYNNRIHVRTSTKTDDFTAAQKMAEQWYFKKQLEIAGGVAPTTKANTFRYAAELALTQYKLDAKQGKRSASYVNGLRKLFNVLNGHIGDVGVSSINQVQWTKLKQQLQQKRALSDRTLHQYRNAVQVVLKQTLMRGGIKTLPAFLSESTGGADDTPRTWFNGEEYKTLIRALRRNIATHKREKTRWQEDAEELRDYALIVANTGMRMGEAMNVRFCDVTFAEERHDGLDEQRAYLEIRNIHGKRGRFGVCKSYYGAANPFTRCIARHGLTVENYQASEQPIFKKYHRDAFRAVLKSAKLYTTQDRTPRKRDLQSLRSTYICFRLLRQVPVFDVANNCRTSVAMIEKHYAKHLSIFASKSINKSEYNLAADEDE